MDTELLNFLGGLIVGIVCTTIIFAFSISIRRNVSAKRKETICKRCQREEYDDNWWREGNPPPWELN